MMFAAKQQKPIFFHLWGHPLHNLVDVRKIIGSVKEHYKIFTAINKEIFIHYVACTPQKAPVNQSQMPMITICQNLHIRLTP